MFTPIPNSIAPASRRRPGGIYGRLAVDILWRRIAPISAGTPSDGKNPRHHPAKGDAMGPRNLGSGPRATQTTRDHATGPLDGPDLHDVELIPRKFEHTPTKSTLGSCSQVIPMIAPPLLGQRHLQAETEAERYAAISLAICGRRLPSKAVVLGVGSYIMKL